MKLQSFTILKMKSYEKFAHFKTFQSGVVHCDLNSLNIIGEKKTDNSVDFKVILSWRLTF